MRHYGPASHSDSSATSKRGCTPAVNYMVKAAAERAGVNPAVSVHRLRHAHASQQAPITLVSATLGHADLKTTSVYAHARPGESSGRYLKTK